MCYPKLPTNKGINDTGKVTSVPEEIRTERAVIPVGHILNLFRKKLTGSALRNPRLSDEKPAHNLYSC